MKKPYISQENRYNIDAIQLEIAILRFKIALIKSDFGKFLVKIVEYLSKIICKYQK